MASLALYRGEAVLTMQGDRITERREKLRIARADSWGNTLRRDKKPQFWVFGAGRRESPGGRGRGEQGAGDER